MIINPAITLFDLFRRLWFRFFLAYRLWKLNRAMGSMAVAIGNELLSSIKRATDSMDDFDKAVDAAFDF